MERKLNIMCLSTLVTIVFPMGMPCWWTS